MNIDGITNGVVLDHIRAGGSMEIYNYLHLNELDCCVAVIQNVKSAKYGKKDIIKIDAEIELDLEVLGYLDPNITVNLVREGRLVEKKHLKLPKVLRGVIKCRNPRCVTATERETEQVFVLEPGGRRYRCAYCESEAK